MENELDSIEIPASKSNYMKLSEETNRFRMLAKPIAGWEYWKTQKDGSRKPVRVKYDGKISTNDVEEDETVKYFWAFPVFDYADTEIKILELTQKSIIKMIKALSRDPDWGSPIGVSGYDIVVNKTGEKLETRYTVSPKPKKELEKGIFEAYKDMHINLEALYTGGDPFNSEEVDLDEINQALAS